MDEVSMNLNPNAHHQDVNIDSNHVINLVEALYSSKNTAEQAEANRILTEIQSSDKAWQLCWTLLDKNHCQIYEVHFFASNALCLKINQSWYQQDEQWLEKELRPKLFELLFKFASSSSDTDKLIIERLSLALATFALRSIPTFWPDAIEDILKAFSPQNLSVSISSQRICDILLKILMYMPEEFSVSLPKQEHKVKLNSQMNKSGPIVFKFLHSLLVADASIISSNCKQNVLKCLTSWTLHSRTSLLEMDEGNVILDILYNLICDEELCSHSCSALAATFSNQKAENYRNSVIEFIPKLANLKQVIDKYISEDEIECAIKIYSLVINFSENYSRLYLRIVLGDGIELEPPERGEFIKQSIFSTIKIILDCTSAPGIYGVDEKYSDISFTFWFSFLENFYYYSDNYNDLLCKTFDPLVDTLLQAFIVKARYPARLVYEKDWNDDQRELYRCYRQDIGDNLSLLAHFPRSRDRILQQLTIQLEQEWPIITQNNTPSQQSNGKVNTERWQVFETILFALKSISESIPFDENIFIPKVFIILSHIKFYESPPLLYCTAAEMISSYSDWLFAHSDHLAIAFELLFYGVNSSDSYVRLMSTLSLKDLTTECQTVLQPYAPRIVESCTKALSQVNSNLSTSEKGRLMHTIGTTLAMCPLDTIMQSLTTLTMPLICEIMSKAQNDPTIDLNCREVILDRLTMLNSLIESLYVKANSEGDDSYEEGDENDPRISLQPNRLHNLDEFDVAQPVLKLLEQMVPILTIISEKYPADEEIMGIICSTIKRSAKSLGIELKPLVKDFLIIIVNAYDPMLNSTILEGSISMYNLFKIDKSLHEYLLDGFARITDKTLEACLAHPLRQLSLTLQHYFEYAHLVCKKFPEFLTNQASGLNFELIYKLAIASLELPERSTLAYACNFLREFKTRSFGNEHLHRIFVNNLELLLGNVFNIFGGVYSTPRNAIDHVTDLLFFIIDCDEAKGPLKLIVDRADYPTSYVSCEQKARFVSKIIHEKNRKKFKDACSEFVLLARNLNRTG